MSRALILRPFAKINLMLRVGPVRPDGFHDVRTVLQSIALSDTLVITPRKGPFTLAMRTPGIPADRSNLVWRAAELLWQSLGRDGEPRDAHIRLEKQIPSAAGLGGGSADAAATLAGLNRVWNGRRSPRDLLRLAARLGSDVPFFLHGGTALGAGRGEELYLLEDASRLGVVIVKPSFGVSTADAYRWLDEDRGRMTTPGVISGEAGEITPGVVRDLDIGWTHGPVPLINDLEAPVAQRHREITDILTALRQEGVSAAAMTGSGSAVFGVFPEAQGQKVARRLRRPDWLVLLTRTLTRREAGRRMGL